MRPIVCCSGTLLNCLSQWLDYWLQTLKPFIDSYIKDSSQMLERLRELGFLTPDSYWVGHNKLQVIFLNAFQGLILRGMVLNEEI